MAAWNAPPPTYDTHYTTSTLTPYLQLPHLLSLTWLAYPILSLLFIAFRLQASLDSSQDAVASAKDNLLASCKAAETAATSAASMPRYLAIASNEQFADAVNGSLRGARAALILALTVMEAIINFIIDLYRSTLLCFLELVVRGGLALLIGAVEEINSVLTSAANALRTSIQNDITSANGAIQTAINAINKINPFSDITAPQITVPNLDGLQNVTLPSSIQDALTKLNASIPSVAELKDAVEDIIDTPFELVKKDINDTFSAFSFNSSVLPVPEQNRLSFCNDMDTSIVDDLGRDLIKTARIGVIILILLALLLIGLNCLLTWYKWRCMKSHLEYTRQAWMTDPTMVHSIKSSSSVPQMTLSDHNLLTLQANSEHPLVTRILNQFSARFHLTPSHHTNMQWFFSYIFHAPALACLLIGIIGILSIEIQLAAMHPLLTKYQDRAASTTADFSNTIATSINQSMYNQSAAYANDVNSRVDAIQSSINDGLFGWVNGTTTSLNTTINNFYTDVENAVTTVFGGTILESPANEFIKCFIGSKVDAIEKALTFLHDNLKIDMPRVNDTVLVLSPGTVNEATQPIAAAAIGGGENGNGEGLVVRLVNSYTDSLRKERLTFIIFLALWGVVVLMGVAILFWHCHGKALIEKRKRRKWESEQRSGINGLVVPFRDGMTGHEKSVAGGSVRNLPSFTPLPSPQPHFLSPRVASPSTRGKDMDYEADSDWDNFFHKKPEQEDSRSVRGSKKFMAIGRKVLGRNKSRVDKEPSLEDASQQSRPDDNRNTVWLNKVMSMVSSKKPSDDVDSVDLANNQAGRGRPQLRIEVNPPSTDFSRPLDYGDASGKSRWSISPIASEAPKTMKKPLAPPRHPDILPATKAHKPAVPSDVESSPFDDPFASGSIRASALPIPLYHGFDTSGGPAHTRSGSSSSPFIKPSGTSQISQSQQLSVPNDRHRRSSSVPSPTWQREADNASVNPMTRMLTTNGHQSALNPFVTPFDDEHRVTIQHNAIDARKSIPTNPFIAL